jgi:lipid II:glycine glycyltransferase (peptidoglycan interpeptide bridge formation enzyme)
VDVREVEKTDENIKAFYKLISETTTRNTFHGNTFDYYKVFLNKIENSQLLLVYK